MNGLKLLFIISDRAKIEKIAKTAEDSGIGFSHILYGRGTAKNEALNLLGLGETEKGVIIAAVNPESVRGIFDNLADVYGFDEPSGGIAFTIPMTSVGGPASLKILRGDKE